MTVQSTIKAPEFNIVQTKQKQIILPNNKQKKPQKHYEKQENKTCEQN